MVTIVHKILFYKKEVHTHQLSTVHNFFLLNKTICKIKHFVKCWFSINYRFEKLHYFWQFIRIIPWNGKFSQKIPGFLCGCKFFNYPLNYFTRARCLLTTIITIRHIKPIFKCNNIHHHQYLHFPKKPYASFIWTVFIDWMKFTAF